MHTPFHKNQFQIGNGSIHYVEGDERKFVISTEKTI